MSNIEHLMENAISIMEKYGIGEEGFNIYSSCDCCRGKDVK